MLGKNIFHSIPHILGMTSDSRQVEPGFVFVAIRGLQTDGHQFIDQAIKKGAVAVVGSEKRSLSVPYFQVGEPRKVLAELAAEFYEHPSQSLRVIGITGTSGKTTTSYLLESIFRSQGVSTGVLGTINFRFLDQVQDASHTTPDPVQLQSFFKKMKDAQVHTVIMEVSSHALEQYRCWGIAFDGMIFTNLSPEHLDYHSDLESYFQAKRLLFTDYKKWCEENGKNPKVVVNGLDPYGVRLQKEIDAKTFRKGDYEPQDLHLGLDGIRFQLQGTNFQSQLLAEFNVENILAAVAVSLELGVDPGIIQKGVENLKGVPGRLERVSGARGPQVLVDYAHKPDALEKVLQTLKDLTSPPSRLITVFGCGGDRDRSKRSVMGEIATRLSDLVWITSDNPRTEDPEVIIQQIRKGISHESRVRVVVDRKEAIHQAISEADSEDVVLIAGKGHETYQIVGSKKLDFDDRKVAQDALERRQK